MNPHTAKRRGWLLAVSVPTTRLGQIIAEGVVLLLMGAAASAMEE
jgi:hypothetical protein